MSMWEDPSLWPWWLWTLSALWVGALLFWQPAGTASRERWGWGSLAIVYAMLLVLGGRIAPAVPAETPRDSWFLWLGLFVFLIGAVTSIGLRTLRWQQVASVATPLGAGIALAALEAPEAALGCGILGVAMARRSAAAPAFDPDGALPRQNHWLAGFAAVVTLVMVIGLVRHALIVESSRIGPSRWQTLFPTPAQTARHTVDADHAAHREPIPVGLWGLVAMGSLAAFVRAASLKRTPSTQDITT
ncbi:MAG: hypothetical protein Q8K78_12625 [Planctomycetaceae bacterium]|nr:hypothetical protein [Planctomycetaceae bacterium]